MLIQLCRAPSTLLSVHGRVVVITVSGGSFHLLRCIGEVHPDPALRKVLTVLPSVGSTRGRTHNTQFRHTRRSRRTHTPYIRHTHTHTRHAHAPLLSTSTSSRHPSLARKDVKDACAATDINFWSRNHAEHAKSPLKTAGLEIAASEISAVKSSGVVAHAVLVPVLIGVHLLL